MAPPVIVSKLLDPRMYPNRDPDFPAAQRPMEPTPEKVTQLLRVLKFVPGASSSAVNSSASSFCSSNDPDSPSSSTRSEPYQHQHGNRTGGLTILSPGCSVKKPSVESSSSSSPPSVTSIPSPITASPAIHMDNRIMIRFVQELLQQPYRENSQEEIGRGLSGFHSDGGHSRDIILDPFKVSDESLGMQRNRRVQFNSDRDLLSRRFILSTVDPYSLPTKPSQNSRNGGSGASGSGQAGSQQEEPEPDEEEEPTKFLLTLYPEQCPFQHPATIAVGGKRDVLKTMVQRAMENEIGAMQWVQENCSRVLSTKLMGFAHHGQSRPTTQILEGFGLLGCILAEFPKEGILYQGPSRECRLTEQAHKHFNKQVAKMVHEMRKITMDQISSFSVPETAVRAAASDKRISLKTQLHQMSTGDVASGDPGLKPLEIRSRFDLVIDALRATDDAATVPSASSSTSSSRPLSPSTSYSADQRPTFSGILRRKGRHLLSRGGRPLPHFNIDDPEAQHPLHRPKREPSSPLRHMVRAADLVATQETLSRESSSEEESKDEKPTSPTSLAKSIRGSCSITLSKRSSATPSSTSVSSAFDRDMTVYSSRRSQKSSFTGAGQVRESRYTPSLPTNRHVSSRQQSSRPHTPSGKAALRPLAASLREPDSLKTAASGSESQKSRKSVIDIFHVGPWRKNSQDIPSAVNKGKGKATDGRSPAEQPTKCDDDSQDAELFEWSTENVLTWPMEFITPGPDSIDGPDSTTGPACSVSKHEQIRLWNALVALERLDSALGSNSRFPTALFRLLPRILALVHDELLFVHSVVLPRRRTVATQGMEEILLAFRPQDIFEGVECVLSHGAPLEPVSWVVASRQHSRRNGTVLAVLNWSHAGFLPNYEENLQAPFVEAAPSTFWHMGGGGRTPPPPIVQPKPEKNMLSTIAKRLSGSLRRSSSALFGTKNSPPVFDGANRTGNGNGSRDSGEDGPPSSDSSISTLSLDYSTKYPAPWPIVNHAFALELTVPSKFMTFQQGPPVPTTPTCSCSDGASSLSSSFNPNAEAKGTGYQSFRSKFKMGKGSKDGVATKEVLSLTPPPSMPSVDSPATSVTFYMSSSSTLSLPYLQRPNMLHGERNRDSGPCGSGSGSSGPPMRGGELVPVSRRVHTRSWTQFQQSLKHESRKNSDMATTLTDCKDTLTIASLDTKAPSTTAATLSSSVSVASIETLRPLKNLSPSASSSRSDLRVSFSQGGSSSSTNSATGTFMSFGGNDGRSSSSSEDENNDDAWMLHELESLDQFGESFIYDFEVPSSLAALSEDPQPSAPSELAPAIPSDSSSSSSSSDDNSNDGTDFNTDPSSTATAAILRALVSVSKTLQNMVVLLESGATILTPAQLSEAIAARQEIAWDREEHRLLQIERAQENFKKLHREAAQRQAAEQEASMKRRQTPPRTSATAIRSPRQAERPKLNHSLSIEPHRTSDEEAWWAASSEAGSSGAASGLRRRPSATSRRGRMSPKNSKNKSSPANRSFKSIFQAWRLGRKSSIKSKKGDGHSLSTTLPLSESSPFPSLVDKGKARSPPSYIPIRSPEDDILYSAPGLQRDPLPSELPAHLFNLTVSTDKKLDTTCCHRNSSVSTASATPSPTPLIIPTPPANCPVFGIRLTVEDEHERERLEREEQAFWRGLEGHWDQSLGSRTWEQQQTILTSSSCPDQPSSSSFGNRPKVTNRVGGNGGGGIALLDLEELERCLKTVERHVRKVEGEVASALYSSFKKNQ